MVANRGEVVVVGAHRITDAEASRASSGGPSRLTSRSEEVAALQGGAADASGRLRPDVSAAGDVSAAVAGVRTAGLLAETHARISATSAAAAQVTRAIANVRYVNAMFFDSAERKRRTACAQKLIFGVGEEMPAPAMDAGRATLTPRSDDAFRRGRAKPR